MQLHVTQGQALRTNIFLPSPAHIQITEKWSCPTSWNSSGLYSLHTGEKAERLRDDPPQLYPSSHPSWCLVLLLRFPSIKPGQQSRAAWAHRHKAFPDVPSSALGIAPSVIHWFIFMANWMSCPHIAHTAASPFSREPWSCQTSSHGSLVHH